MLQNNQADESRCLKKNPVSTRKQGVLLQIIVQFLFDLYTILPLPISHGVWHIQGESGGGRILRSSRARILQSCEQSRWRGQYKNDCLVQKRFGVYEYLVNLDVL